MRASSSSRLPWMPVRPEAMTSMSLTRDRKLAQRRHELLASTARRWSRPMVSRRRCGRRHRCRASATSASSQVAQWKHLLRSSRGSRGAATSRRSWHRLQPIMMLRRKVRLRREAKIRSEPSSATAAHAPARGRQRIGASRARCRSSTFTPRCRRCPVADSQRRRRPTSVRLPRHAGEQGCRPRPRTAVGRQLPSCAAVAQHRSGQRISAKRSLAGRRSEDLSSSVTAVSLRRAGEADSFERPRAISPPYLLCRTTFAQLPCASCDTYNSTAG